MPSVSEKQHRAARGQIGLVCNKCNGVKEIVWHVVGGVRKQRSICMKCHSATSYKSRLKRKDHYNAQIKERRRTSNSVRAYNLWRSALWRAKTKGLEFTITRQMVEKWMNEGICQVTGLRLRLDLTDRNMNSLSPSLDRIEPLKGYTKENTRLVCWIYNRAKGYGTDADVLMLAEALLAK